MDNTEWLGKYSQEQQEELRGYAEYHFEEPLSRYEPLQLYCPRCETIRCVDARMVELDSCHVETAVNPEGNVRIDWESANIGGDFHYECEWCGHTFAESLEELEEVVRGQRNDPKCTPHDFCDDLEKMDDFYALTKEEFLSSYSYLTEEEYNLTLQKEEQKRGVKNE